MSYPFRFLIYIIYLASYSGDLGNIIELENNVQFLLWTDKLTQRVSFLATSYNSPVWGNLQRGHKLYPCIYLHWMGTQCLLSIGSLNISQCRRKSAKSLQKSRNKFAETDKKKPQTCLGHTSTYIFIQPLASEGSVFKQE